MEVTNVSAIYCRTTWLLTLQEWGSKPGCTVQWKRMSWWNFPTWKVTLRRSPAQSPGGPRTGPRAMQGVSAFEWRRTCLSMGKLGSWETEFYFRNSQNSSWHRETRFVSGLLSVPRVKRTAQQVWWSRAVWVKGSEVFSFPQTWRGASLSLRELCWIQICWLLVTQNKVSKLQNLFYFTIT